MLIHAAAKNNYALYIKQLLVLGAELEAKNDRDETAAEVALCNAKVDAFKALVEAGANLDFERHKRSPFAYAEYELLGGKAPYAEILRILRIRKEKNQKKL